MKKVYFKKLKWSILALVVVSVISASGFMAYAYVDNNRDYSFNIAAQQVATKYANDEYRNTYDNNNAWKINLRSSGDGAGTATVFRLCLADNSGAASWHTITEGSDTHYYSATDAGDHTYVFLQGKDNNKIAKTYKVSGYWDEETGLSPD